MYLGDDNALHPQILAFADRTISDYDLDVMSWRVCTYFHPDWNVAYGALPDRGNILFIDVGTTQRLYQCRSREVLAHFCHHLRAYGCFACMLNCLFRKALADDMRKRMGGIFLGISPEWSSSFIIIGAARPDGYAFFDGFGAIAGRSGNSSEASMLSRGKANLRYFDYIEEYRGQDMFPHHEPKFLVPSNLLAGPISLVRTLLPEHFAQYNFDPVTLARKTIDDLYIDRTVPWIEDPALIGKVDQFISSLPASAAAEIFAYRDECKKRMQEADPTLRPPGSIRNSDEARASLGNFWRTADPERRRLASRLVRELRRNPIGKFWTSGGTTCIDMSLYDARDIADIARNFPRLLAHLIAMTRDLPITIVRSACWERHWLLTRLGNDPLWPLNSWPKCSNPKENRSRLPQMRQIRRYRCKTAPVHLRGSQGRHCARRDFKLRRSWALVHNRKSLHDRDGNRDWRGVHDYAQSPLHHSAPAPRWFVTFPMTKSWQGSSAHSTR